MLTAVTALVVGEGVLGLGQKEVSSDKAGDKAPTLEPVPVSVVCSQTSRGSHVQQVKTKYTINTGWLELSHQAGTFSLFAMHVL